MNARRNDSDRKEAEERAKLAAKLKESREYLGFPQEQVAEHLGLSRSALSNIENGQRKVEVGELVRLAALYKKPVTYFTGTQVAPAGVLPEDVEHLARKASKLTPNDRAELTRFADFLHSRSADRGDGASKSK